MDFITFVPGKQAAEPLQPPQRNWLQLRMIRVFDVSLAGNGFFGVVAGSTLAIVVGIVVSWLLILLVHLATAQIASRFYSGDNIAYVLGLFPFHAPLKEGAQLFLVAHGIAEHFVSTGGEDIYSAPLHGLLVLPALLLTAGGYISACTDLHNRVQRSLLRGAAIAIPYTVLLLIVATQTNGYVSSTSITGSLTMDTMTLIVFGVLWGVLFGLLGASLKVAQGHWRHMVRQYLQDGSVQAKGMIVGGMSATGLGIAFSLLWLYSLISSMPANIFFQGDNCGSGSFWQIRVLWNIVTGPLYAVNLFLFSLGAPITAHLTGQDTIISCFYITPSQPSLALFDGNLRLPIWVYSLLLIPAVSLFLGGRASAALSRAKVRGVGPRVVQGAAIALPFTVLSIFCSIISTISHTHVPSNPTTVASSTIAQTSTGGVGAIDLLLWTLLWAVVFGALGGAYQDSTLQKNVRGVLSGLASPVVRFSRPVDMLLDRLSGFPRSITRSHARSLLYGAFFLCLLLIVVTVATSLVLIIWNQTLSFSTNQSIKNVLSCILIALPGLLLLCSCISALSRDPLI
jgi:hypothetical protein